ncbi:PR domain zinc finger protein 5-like [Maniola jurtina]|uniref:PR domain zinc finger protein 5-like n=1 Tax=Maniola jurtina TaxID=191418 RepID=UPI001E68F8C7|nr:PR domain zinc finger protein 5-like [Maniola jurtina]
MVDNQGYLVPLYASPPQPIDVNPMDNTKRLTKVKNPCVTNSIEPNHHPVLSNVVYCPNCELNFLDANEYEKHKSKCKRKHTCTYCSATFQRNDHLKRHIISLHSNTKFNICPVCNEDCKSYESLLKHIKTHPNDTSLNCRDCQQEFKSLYDLVVHESRHLWLDSHSCTYCSKIFKRRDHMLRHIQTLHLQQFTVCPICNQKYKRKDHALRHIREKHKMAVPYGGLKEFQEKMTSQE